MSSLQQLITVFADNFCCALALENFAMFLKSQNEWPHHTVHIKILVVFPTKYNKKQKNIFSVKASLRFSARSAHKVALGTNGLSNTFVLLKKKHTV